MAKKTDVGTITVKPDLSEFRQAMMDIAAEFEQRIDAAVARAASTAGEHPHCAHPTIVINTASLHDTTAADIEALSAGLPDYI